MRKFLLTTVLGGVLFLIPFVMVVVLLGKGFNIMRTVAPLAAAAWMAHRGDKWLAGIYPPDDAFRVQPEGL